MEAELSKEKQQVARRNNDNLPQKHYTKPFPLFPGAIMGAILTRPEIKPFRTIDILREGVIGGEEQSAMADNSVVTSKYNVITFVPRSLFEQFRRIANVYFLVISVLMMLGWYTDLFESPLAPFSTLIPLILVLSVTMVKDGAEDLKRHRSDNRVSESNLMHVRCVLRWRYRLACMHLIRSINKPCREIVRSVCCLDQQSFWAFAQLVRGRQCLRTRGAGGFQAERQNTHTHTHTRVR